MIASSEAFGHSQHNKKEVHVHPSMKDSWEDEQMIIMKDGKNIVMPMDVVLLYI